MYSLGQILRDLAEEHVVSAERIRTVWQRIQLFLNQKKLEDRTGQNANNT